MVQINIDGDFKGFLFSCIGCALNTKTLSHSQQMQVFYFLIFHDCLSAVNYDKKDFLERISYIQQD